jgi:hypothetical protein
MAVSELLGHLLVAASAIFGRYNGGDEGALMLPGVGLTLLGRVAIDATHPERCVAAVFPLLDDAGIFFGVAVNTALVLGGYDDCCLPLR